MLVVEVLAAVGVLLAVALVATGRWGGMTPAPPDRAPFELPDRPLVGADLESLRIAVGFRGYRMDEVDRLLDRLAHELAERDARISELAASRAGETRGEAPGETPDASGRQGESRDEPGGSSWPSSW